MNNKADKINSFKYPDYENLTDEELIGRMHEISLEYPAILNYLITRHKGLVKFIVSTLGGIMPSDVEDYEQEGMIGLYDSIEKYDHSKGAGFKTYASVVIRNRLLNVYASRNNLKNSAFRDYISTDPTDTDPEWKEKISIQSPDMTPEEIALFVELKEKFGTVMENSLTDAERTALLLKMNGVPVKEIAHCLNITEKAAEKAISRARKKIRNSI